MINFLYVCTVAKAALTCYSEINCTIGTTAINSDHKKDWHDLQLLFTLTKSLSVFENLDAFAQLELLYKRCSFRNCVRFSVAISHTHTESYRMYLEHERTHSDVPNMYSDNICVQMFKNDISYDYQSDATGIHAGTT